MKGRFWFFIFLFFTLVFACLPTSRASAGLVINEIMYDLEGADTIDGKSREWVEIFNDTNAEINLNGWKFNDGDNATNHGLNEPPANGGQGSLLLPAGGYAVLAGDAGVFLSEHPGYSGTVIDTVISLGQQDDRVYVLRIVNTDGAIAEEVSYATSLGAKGDGNSLQKIGENWQVGIPTPGTANSSTSQQEQQPAQSESSDGSAASQYVPPENLPKIKAYAGKDKTTIAGVLTEFRGLAFGLNDEPLENARYIWNFGDGVSEEGQNIFHYYKYPGEYVVFLDVSSGSYSASDRISVKAAKNEVFISEIKPGSDSFIEIRNASGYEVNLSGWIIRFGAGNFIFPRGSFIKPAGYLVIPASVSNIIPSYGEGSVDFLYPGNFLADTFLYKGVLSEGQSFSLIKDAIVVSSETPGAENKNTETLIQGDVQIKSVAETAGAKEEIETQSKVKPEEISQEESAEKQEANILTSQKNTKNSANFYFWLVLGVAAASGAGVLFVRQRKET